MPRSTLHKGQTFRQWEAVNVGMTENDWNYLREQFPPGGDFDLLINEIELSLKDDYSPNDTMYFEARLRDGWRRQWFMSALPPKADIIGDSQQCLLYGP